MTHAASASQDEPRRWQRFQPVAKLRAWGATLKPNSPLREQAPATIAVLRALVLLGGGELTFVQIAQKAGGISWRQVQRVVAWAKAGRLIHVTRLGRGRGQIYVLMPQLAVNFLGRKPLKKRRDDMTSKSHQGRRDFIPSRKRKSASRCDATPTPRPPPQTGAGVSADSGATSQPGREATASVAPENFAARAAPRPAEAAGRVQRSPAAAAPPRRNLTAEERAAVVAKTRAATAEIRKHDPPRRRR